MSWKPPPEQPASSRTQSVGALVAVRLAAFTDRLHRHRLLLVGVPVGRDRGVDLRLDRRHVEAAALLHGRVLEEALGRPADLLLDEREAPELVHEPVVVGYRAAFA